MTRPPRHLAHPQYRPDIDGLRAIAVLAVVAFHAFPQVVKGGFIGVDVFFVISGFLISTIIFESLDNGMFSFSAFYARRIRRIFPALLLVLAASFSFGWFGLLADEYKQLGKHIAAAAGFVSNFLLQSETGYFDNAADTKPLLHLWSLCIEEQFYIIWPFMIWILRYGKSKSNLLFVLLITIVSFSMNVWNVEKDPVATFYTPQTRFWELSCGSILAWLLLPAHRCHHELKGKKHLNAIWLIVLNFISDNKVFISNIISVFGIFILLYGFVNIDKGAEFPGKWAVVPVLSAIFIILSGESAWIGRKILSNRIFVWFGLISYPLYLWHWPLLSFARIVEGEVPGHAIRIAAVMMSVGLAWLTYQFVERPIRQDGGSKAKVSILVLLMIVIGSAGYSVYVHDGLKFRDSVKFVQNQMDDLDFKIDRMTKGWLCDPLIARGTRCFYSGSNPSVVIMGDSHAARIYVGLREFYSAQGKGVAVFGGGGGCPPLLNVVSKMSSGDDTQNCLVKMSDPLKQIINTPTIEEVIFASRGPLYTTSNGFGDFDGDRYGQWVLHDENNPQGAKSNSDVFFGALGATLDALLAAGKKVTYLLDVPELGFDIRSCLASRPITLTSRTREPCAVLRSQFESRNRDFRARLSQVLASRADVKVVDLAEALCDEKYCYGSKDGVLLYSDDDHLSRRGSEYVVHRLWDKFR
ncbi:Peptidoglycan/LPS O-acetylase OafA/YrhL, contains acyltransferase and SGNH-hydrolase domains [Rhizobium sp. RU35A]|uniref:acyltransferase family protein n=1 Tax=Rhizobium sp. RU35A TaxID=1907414 RepID=UPI0009566767|nr:acyltransferase family protein [Rhizobium sp. RU35A]SIQ93186.1 Peptidoglycan/LPS O-acetylase OafA/YrhL, contains acyltransferase and SGNH-hydrolase domains [Rhizobium sp. RU35A]